MSMLDKTAPKANLSVLDGVAMMVGIIVGIGIFKTPALVTANVIPTRTERHALAQSRRPMGMTRYSLRSENPGMSQPSRGLVLLGTDVGPRGGRGRCP